MGSTLTSFNLDFYKEKSTAENGYTLRDLFDQSHEEVVYELLLNSKSFSSIVKRAENILRKDPSRLPGWD